MKPLPKCNSCGKQLQLILKSFTWGFDKKEPDKIDIFCLSCGKGKDQVLIADLAPEHQKFFEELKKRLKC